MFNLLPDNLKQKVKSEYRLRLLSVVVASVFFIQISFLLFLLPSWLISSDKEREAVSQRNMMDSSLSTLDTKSVFSTITGINTKLNIVNSIIEYPKIVPFINTILSKRNREIYINELNYIGDDGNTGEIGLRGVSSTRESLVSFVKKLESSSFFKTVNLPISNFAKDKNIDFSINMTIAP